MQVIEKKKKEKKRREKRGGKEEREENRSLCSGYFMYEASHFKWPERV